MPSAFGHATRSIVILLDGVWKSFGETVALRDASFSLGRGEVALLTGPSGAGKSTLLRILYAADRADRGRVVCAGFDLARLRQKNVPFLRRCVGVVFQDFKLLPERTVRENIGIALEIRNVPRREVRFRVDAVMAAVGLLDVRAEQKIERLSGGEQQRVAVARAIVGEPEIVLADEPTGNLDPERSRELLELFEVLRARGATMVIATHDPDVMRFGLAHSWRRVRLEDGAVVDLAAEAISRPYSTQPAAERTGEVIALEGAMLRKLLEKGQNK